MKFEGWETALENHLQSYMRKRFEWGVCDCLLFASDWAVKACGIDPMSYKLEGDPDTIRGAYASKREAASLIGKLRGDASNIMGVHFKEISPSKAKRGDIALHSLQFGLTFGVVASDGITFFKNEKAGLVPESTQRAVKCWSVE